MNRKSITQEYYMLATNKKGQMPAMRSEECKAGILAAGISDLLLTETAVMNGKKITIVQNLPEELQHIAPLYEYLQEKPRTVSKLMNDYCIALTNKRIQQLVAALGESLLADNSVTQGEGRLFGSKGTYIPEQNSKNQLIEIFKNEVGQDAEMTPHDMALFIVLHETNNLKQYFSPYEKEAMKEKWKAIRKNPHNKIVKKIVNYVNDTMAILASLTALSAT